MPQQRVFEPNVTLGQLLMLAKLGALSQAPGAKPSWKDLEDEFGASRDTIQRTMRAIASAFGPIGTDAETGSTKSPNIKGRNIGGAAVLADLIIKIAQDPETNQSRLMQMISELIDHAQGRYETGILNRAPHGTSF